jgi:hypothetical protein
MTSATSRSTRGDCRPPTKLQARLTMVEPARRHGPFDTRHPVRLKLAATTWELQPDEEGLERLDWSAFLARFFPDRRRHDFEALAAYGSYRNALEQASAAVAVGAHGIRSRAAALPGRDRPAPSLSLVDSRHAVTARI